MPVPASIIECFTGFIGIRKCGSQEPGSSLFVNSLPGITQEMMDSIANTDDKTYAEMWKKVEQRAILAFRTRFMAQLNGCYQINERKTVECLACENKDLLATSLWYYLGVELVTEWIFSNRENVYTTIKVEEAEELRSEYQVRFEEELKYAVQGINVEHSPCLSNEEDCPQQNGPIHWRESIM